MFGRTATCLLACAVLAACGTKLEQAEQAKPVGDAHQAALYEGYLGLSKMEYGEGDYGDSDTFARRVGGIVLAAGDSMGAQAGVSWLRQRRTPVLALSGVLTAAPLQVSEAFAATGLPCYNRPELATASNAMDLLGQAQRHIAAVKAAPGGPRHA